MSFIRFVFANQLFEIFDGGGFGDCSFVELDLVVIFQRAQ